MTKKTGGSSGDNRDQHPEGTLADSTEIRTLLVEMQTATQTSIQQLGDTVSTLADRIEALTTAITARVDPQAQHAVHAPPQQQHPLHLPPPQQQNLQHHQQQHQLPPIIPHRQQQQRFQRPQQHAEARPHDLLGAEDEDEHHRRVYRDDLVQRNYFDHRWEQSFKVDIP
uniref:Uncharacterized protein n=1 Tax=Brassica oleracea var. oleracea TaxID=109376 RepID=A0A0D3AAR3_BRAOL